MCVVFFSIAAGSPEPLVLIANRDEYYERPTAPAAHWPDAPGVFAGRDLVHGGTWLGIAGSRFAAVTNYREPGVPRGRLSRGDLVAGFLTSETDPFAYMQSVAAGAAGYSGFNLVAGDVSGGRFFYFSNREGRIRQLSDGVYGLSNSLLDVPWPKVVRGKSRLSGLVGAGDTANEHLFEILSDRRTAPDDELPDTGVGYEIEKLLSSVFIETPVYGTRSSSIVRGGRSGALTLVERVFR